MPHGQEFENQPSPIKELEKQPTSSKIELQKANLNKYVTRSTPLAEIINWKLFVENRAKTPPNSLDDLLSDVEAELKFFTEVNGAFGESYHAIVDSILQNKERVPSLDPLIPEQRKRARQLSEALAFFELQIQREGN